LEIQAVGSDPIKPDLQKSSDQSTLDIHKAGDPTKVDDLGKGAFETKRQGIAVAQHYYDRHGRPLTPAQAADDEARHEPVYHHLDAKGAPISDQAFNARYSHLDHYRAAAQHGTHFYDDHGRPLTPDGASQYEAQHHHAPVEHIDAAGRPMTNEQWAHYQATHTKTSGTPAPTTGAAPGPTGVEQ
jgi:hypothetical protein